MKIKLLSYHFSKNLNGREYLLHWTVRMEAPRSLLMSQRRQHIWILCQNEFTPPDGKHKQIILIYK